MHANFSLSSKRRSKAKAGSFIAFSAPPILIAMMMLFLLTPPPIASATTARLSPQATTTPTDLTTKLDTFFTQLTAQDAFSGTVLVSRDQTILLRAGYGLADREGNIPNTPPTKMRIASITKKPFEYY